MCPTSFDKQECVIELYTRAVPKQREVGEKIKENQPTQLNNYSWMHAIALVLLWTMQEMYKEECDAWFVGYSFFLQ